MKDTYKPHITNIRHKYKRLLIPILLLATVVFSLSRFAAAAGTATMTLSPASGSYTINGGLSVTIHENSGSDAVNAVEADITYDQSKLQFVNIDAGSSAFDLSGPGTGGSGSVKISRAKSNTSVTGDQVVATVNFTVLAGSGSTSISFANSSQIIRTSDTANVWNGSASGGTYTMTTPATPPPPPPSPSPSPTPTPTPKTPTTNQSKPTTPVISSPSTTSSVTTPAPAPAPADDTSVVSTTTGYYVAIKVIDANSKPVSGAVVLIEGLKPVTTGSDGLASFSGVGEGQNKVTVNAKGQVTNQTINVVSGNPTAIQQFSVSVKVSSKINPWEIIGPIIAIVLIILAFIIMRIKRRGSGATTAAAPPAQSPQPSGAGAALASPPNPGLPTGQQMVYPEAMRKRQ